MDQNALTRRGLVRAGIGGATLVAGAAGLQAQPSPPAPGTLTVAPTSQAGLSPRLTMHAIDTFHGTPGAGMVCDLSVMDGKDYMLIKTVTTAANGRSPDPLLVDDALKPGRYELLMHFEDYFKNFDIKLPTPNFLTLVPVRFVIKDVTQRYHLPVLFSPWGFSYYRGS